MNCRACREQLLNVLDPSAVPPEVALHLEECTACAHLRRRLVQIEDNATRIPVPPSQGPAALKRMLFEPAAPPRRVAPFSVQKAFAWLALGTAACLFLAVFALVWSRRDREPAPIAEQNPTPAPPRQQPAERPPFLALLLDCDVKLATAESTAQRLAAVSDLAGVLQDETRTDLTPKSTQALAAMYQETLRDTLLPLAAQLPTEQRTKSLVPIVQGLARFHEQATLLAPTDPALAEMAQLANQTRGELLALLPGDIPATPAENRPQPKASDWSADVALAQTMIATARKLAQQKEPLERAQLAQDLAERVGQQIQAAAKSRQGHRAAELSGYFNTLLTEAVSHNLALARSRVPANAPPSADLDRFVAAVARSTETVENQLKDAANDGAPVEGPSMEAAIQAVAQGRREVENTAKGKGKSADPASKSKGKGKGKGPR